MSLDTVVRSRSIDAVPLLTVLLTSLFPATVAARQPQTATVQAADGTALSVRYYAAPHPGPGVLLHSMCAQQFVGDWDGFAASLPAAGIHAVTFDYRGHGRSKGTLPGRQPLDAMFAYWTDTWVPDAESVLAFLKSRPGVDQSRIAVAGASCGVFVALKLAERHPDVRAAVLLAGPYQAAQRQFVTASNSLAVLSGVSAEEGAVVESMRQLASASSHPHTEFVLKQGAGHGTEMLTKTPDLASTIREWLSKALGLTKNSPAAVATMVPAGKENQLHD